MSKNVVKPRTVSFEEALRNLASRLTGRPAAELPRSQEGIVQFMAENAPAPDELVEVVAREAAARLAEGAEADSASTAGAEEFQDSAEAAEGAAEPAKPKTARKTTAAKAEQ